MQLIKHHTATTTTTTTTTTTASTATATMWLFYGAPPVEIDVACSTANSPTNIMDFGGFDSNCPGDSLWAWEFHPFELRLCLSQTL